MANRTEEEFTLVLPEMAPLSCTDSEFRQLDLTNPVAASAQVCEKLLSGDVTIGALNNSGAVRYFPLLDPIPGLKQLHESKLMAIGDGATATDTSRLAVPKSTDGARGRYNNQDRTGYLYFHP